MPPVVIDLVTVALILGMTYALMSEGLWGAALMCFNVIFAGVITFNFYEPAAAWVAANASMISWHADSVCMLGIFCVCVWIFRLSTETLAPAMVRFPMILFNIGRIVFGLVGATVTVAIVLLGFEAASVHKEVFDYRRKIPFNMGLDREWLGFFQWTTGAIFADYRGPKDWQGDYLNAKVFDSKGEWLLNHQTARPFGEGDVLETKDGAAAGAAPATGEGGAGAGGGNGPGGAPPAGGGGNDRDPKIIGPAAGGGVVLPPG